ncbi:sialate O-acetylesterase [Roseateles sp.]|uniref:sialate O-acetylesterase n=1 Tax=Roseateles sp. TaxID=1971397 RepID=UPI0039EB5F8E
MIAPLQRLALAMLTFLTTAAHAQDAGLPPERLHIYLLMGQSNMAGRDTRDLAAQVDDPRILALTADGRWAVARDPIHAKTGRAEPGVGPGIAFARELLGEDRTRAVGLIPTAVGGTPLRRWVKGGDLYEQALSRAREASRTGVIRGVLWHQGETDAENPANAASYGARLARMFQDLRQDLGRPELPIVVGEMGRFTLPARLPEATTVRGAQRHMRAALPNIGFADSTDLGHLGDDLHFSADAARELGRRFAHAMQALQARQTVALWPAGRMPGPSTPQAETRQQPERRDATRIAHVSQPTLTIYPAATNARPAPAVIVAPGGGYQYVVVDKEGSDVAAWLNAQGFTALVLKYRVPGNRDGALADLQRAIALARTHAAEWQIAPGRLGVVGFSAGGHLAARASTAFDRCTGQAGDASDTQSCRPDFALLVYPAYLDETGGPAQSRQIDVPPTLIVHSEDDSRFVVGSRAYQAALAATGKNHQMLLYGTGGHGYGLHSTGEAGRWPQDALPWLRAQSQR